MTTVTLRLSTATPASQTTAPAARRIHRRVFTWELAGILTLMGSSAAYALFALTHLG